MLSLRFLLRLTGVLLFVGASSTSGAQTRDSGVGAQAVTLLHQFGNGSWAENLAVTKRDMLLVSLVDRPEVHLIDPTVRPATSTLVKRFPHTTACLALVEVEEDKFVVATSNFSLSTGKVDAHSVELWQIAIVDGGTSRQAEFVTHKLANLPDVGLINGGVLLSPGLALFADSQKGTIIRFDVAKKVAEVVQRDAALLQPGATQLGVNGLRFLEDHLYFSNTAQRIIGRVQIDLASGRALGPHIKVADVASDDFEFRRRWSVEQKPDLLVAANLDNEILRLPLTVQGAFATQVPSVVVGGINSTLVAGVTSVRLGRSLSSRHSILYATTGGGLLDPYITHEGAKVVAINLSKLPEFQDLP